MKSAGRPIPSTSMSSESESNTTLRDLAALRASSIDLAAVLDTAAVAPLPTTTTDAYVLRSYDFAHAARAAIKIRNRGDVEAQVERVNDVRDKLEDVAAGLRDG